MLKKNKNIEWISQNPQKKIKVNEHFESTLPESSKMITQPKGIILWVDAAQLSNQNNKNISSWASMDNSIKLQFNAINNPGPVVKLNVLNNLPVVQFNSNSNMTISDVNKVPFKDDLPEYTFAFVARQMNISNKVIFSKGDGFGNLGQNLIYSDGTKNGCWIGGSFGQDLISKSNDEWDLYILKRNSNGTASLRRNGVEIINGGNTRPLSFLIINGGGGVCQIAEIILSNTVLSNDDTVKLETYLAKKWDLLKSLDQTHPSWVKSEPNIDSPVSGFPADSLKMWLDASVFTKSGSVNVFGKDLTLDNNKYYLENTTKDIKTHPTVKLNGKNNLSTLVFTPEQFLTSNNTFTSASYTIAFVARQTGGVNGRLFTGFGNKCYGYDDNKKHTVITQGLAHAVGDDEPSNTEWDLMVIRRNSEGKTTLSRNGIVIWISPDFVNINTNTGFDGLQINTPKPGNGEVAEVFVWDKFLNLYYPYEYTEAFLVLK